MRAYGVEAPWYEERTPDLVAFRFTEEKVKEHAQRLEKSS